MSRKIFELFALTAGLFISAHASENVNTPENRQFLKQQETLSQQLREKPDTQLQAWAEQQVRANPLQHSDNQFLDELVRKQQAAQKDKPQQGAVYFVSFSISPVLSPLTACRLQDAGPISESVNLFPLRRH